MRLFRKQHAVGARPGTLVVSTEAPAPKIKVMEFGPDGCDEWPVDDIDALKPAHSGRLRWIDVQGLGDESTLRAVARRFDIHPLVLEDVVNIPQRAKFEAYPGQHLIIVRMFRLVDQVHVGEQLSIVVVPGAVITFQEHYGDVLEPVRVRIRESTSRLRRGEADYLAYAIVDTVVDGYFPLVEAIGDRLEALEEAALEDPHPRLLRGLSEERFRLIALRRALWPLREALRELGVKGADTFGAELSLFFRDSYDHAVQLAEVVESYREIVGGIMNTYLSALSNRTNEIMRVLTLMASIFIPLTFVAGIYGMNFSNMPELQSSYGYPIVLAIMAGMAGGMWLWFWRRGWVGRSRDDD